MPSPTVSLRKTQSQIYSTPLSIAADADAQPSTYDDWLFLIFRTSLLSHKADEVRRSLLNGLGTQEKGIVLIIMEYRAPRLFREEYEQSP